MPTFPPGRRPETESRAKVDWQFTTDDARVKRL